MERIIDMTAWIPIVSGKQGETGTLFIQSRCLALLVIIPD